MNLTIAFYQLWKRDFCRESNVVWENAWEIVSFYWKKQNLSQTIFNYQEDEICKAGLISNIKLFPDLKKKTFKSQKILN